MRVFLSLLFFLLPISAFCAFSPTHPQTTSPEIGEATYDFIENKGQWENEIKFKTNIPHGAFFITQNGFVYNFQSAEDMLRMHDLYEQDIDIENEIVNYHAYRVSFLGSNTSAAFKGADVRSYYHNYFIGNDETKWAGNVPLYGEMNQIQIYPGIDAKIYSSEGSLKYDFIVQPNSDPSQIQLKYEGVTPKILSSGDLQIKTSVNEVMEQKPFTYQIIDGNQVIVPSKYVLENNVLSYAFPEGYNTKYPLIIDPTLIFATYSGATGSAAYSYTTTYDDNGSLYAGTDSWGLGWPTTTGAFQSNFAGGSHDVGINKYTADGSALVYSTYYGGSGADYPNAMIVNDLDELIIMGNTMSGNLPTTTGCYDNTFNGGRDVFVAHFNSTGTALIGATYIGTNATEPGTFTMTGWTTSVIGQNTTSPLELNVDANGNIWGLSNTTSTQFPTTANAFQPTHGGGTDGVIFQFDPTCSNLMYSSFLGGSANETIFGIQFNSLGQVVVCGATQSTNFPTTPGVLNTTSQGGIDGYVTIIDPTTGNLVQSTYLGTTAADQAVNLQIDVNDNIYVLGRTLGNYPISPGVYNIPNGDVFIEKLSPTLTTSLLSTRMGVPGSSSVYVPTAFLLDMCENIYIAGLGNLPGNMPLTPDAFSNVTNNFWFGVLYPNFSDLLFGSYYGSPQNDHTHVGVSRLDPNGMVYHSVCSASANFPTTPGVFAPSKTNSGQDIISFKFDFDATGVRARIGLPPNVRDTICAPFAVNFENNSTSPNSMTFNWDFGDGATSTTTSPSHTYTVPGVYNVILHAHSDSACITDSWDTLKLTVLEVFPPQVVSNDTLVCDLGLTLDLSIDILNPNSNQEIEWGPPLGILSGNNQTTVTVDPLVNTTYYFTVRDSVPGICGFSTSDTIHVNYAPGFVNILTPDTAVCELTQIQLRAEASPDYTYKWSPMLNMNDPNIQNPHLMVINSNTYTLTASYPGCPDVKSSVNISMDSLPRITLPRIETCGTDSIDIVPYIDPELDGYIGLWTPSTNLRDDYSVINKFSASPGNYIYNLRVKTPRLGCTSDHPVSIAVYEPIHLKVYPSDTTILSGKSFKPRVDGEAYNWSWWPPQFTDNPYGKNPLLSPDKDVEFTVFALSKDGCMDSATIKVTMDYESDLFVPSAFTPNGDGLNDVFSLENLKFEKLLSFKVFNRVGQLVFETLDAKKGWDGTFNNKPADPGVYFYMITVSMPRGEIVHFKGDVTLIR